jgi:ribosomal-protein-alanine N-acetyltransferase
MIAAEDDVDAIMRIMQVAFDPTYGEAWTRGQVMDALVLGQCHYGLADTQGAVPVNPVSACGFYLSRHSFEEEELLLLAVDPAYRRVGIGRQLLSRFAEAATERHSRRLLLEMRRDNPASALYLHFGFKPVGVRPNYYRGADGMRHDAITFSLDCN